METKKEYLNNHISSFLDEYRDIYFENTGKTLELKLEIIKPAVISLMNKNDDFNMEIIEFIKDTKEEIGDWDGEYNSFLGFGKKARARRLKRKTERRTRRVNRRKTRRDNKNIKKLTRKGMLTQQQISGLMSNQQLSVEDLNEMGLSEAEYSLMQAQTPELPVLINPTTIPSEGMSTGAIVGIGIGVVAVLGLILILK